MTDGSVSSPAIELSGVTKRFGRTTALHSLDLSVERGELFALLGPNGAGKSTTIGLLTTLSIPDAGTVKVAGWCTRSKPVEVRRNIGVVFQTSSLDDELTALENLMLHARVYGLKNRIAAEKVRSLLQQIDLSDRANQLVKNFSGGMRRRLEVARAFVHEPDVIFLDEPTLGLDPQTRNFMWSYLKKLNESRGTTVFFSTHYMHEVEQFATNVAVIDQGRVVAKGLVQDVMRATGEASFERAYLKLTGLAIREDRGDA